MNREALEAATRAIKEAFSRYYVEGTSDNDLHSPPYHAPWYLIDTSTTEPEVNWPGELIQEYNNPQAAYDHRERLAAQAAIEAYLAALPDEGGLVRRLRAGAKILVERPGEWYDAVKTLRGAADALGAARAKLHGDVVDLGDLSRSQYRRLLAMAEAPKGWRLVPEEPTEEMRIAGLMALVKKLELEQEWWRKPEQQKLSVAETVKKMPVEALTIRSSQETDSVYKAYLATAPELGDD